MKLRPGRFHGLLVALALLGSATVGLRSLPQPEAARVQAVESPQLFPSLSPSPSPSRSPSPQVDRSPQPEREIDPADAVYRQVNSAVVTVYAGREVGSGSFVRSTGWVLTNRHVVRETAQVTVKTADQTVYEGEVRSIDIRNDLALIQLTTAARFPVVPLVKSLTLQPGETVFAIGSPFGQAGTLTTGTFTRITERGSLQTSPGLLKPGNSGGPLLNDRGEMVGVNKGLLEDDSGLATSAIAVQEFLERNLAAP
ncbi:MAG TPA: S1C family serine protease [Thermosynechococcaceae cyanobacterium]